MKKLLLGIVILLLGTLPILAQTEVTLHFYNNGSQDFTVSEYGKIYFDNGYLYIDEGTSTPYSFEVANIQKMLFSHTLDIEDIATDDLRIYPNPASTYLKIESNREQNHYQIFSMEGRILQTGVCKNGESIGLSTLPQGLYLINVDGQTFKITKL